MNMFIAYMCFKYLVFSICMEFKRAVIAFQRQSRILKHKRAELKQQRERERHKERNKNIQIVIAFFSISYRIDTNSKQMKRSIS